MRYISYNEEFLSRGNGGSNTLLIMVYSKDK